MTYIAAVSIVLLIAGLISAARLGYLANRAAAEASRRREVLRSLDIASGRST